MIRLLQILRDIRTILFAPMQLETIHDPFWEELQRSLGLARAKKEIFVSRLKPAPVPVAPVEQPAAATKRSPSAFIVQLKQHLRSTELWLGVFFGAATRVGTKLAILAAFASAPKVALMASFIACATAGLAAGIVTHRVRERYRYFRKIQVAEKDRDQGKARFESAVLGLFGGTLGGYAILTMAFVTHASVLTLGATAGLIAGLVYAGVKEIKTSREHNGEVNWRRMAYQGAAFGAVGGILGLFSVDLFAAHTSIAATVPVGDAGSVVYVPHALGPDPCGTDICGVPRPPAPQPITIVQPAPPPPEVHETVKHIHHHHHHYHRPKAKISPIQHVKHVKKVRHIKKVIPPKETIIKQVVEPLPPPRVIPPPPVPVPVDPCMTGPCAPSCNSVQLHIEGPCADPRTPCVERIAFNEKGIATSAILEPRLTAATGPYFELQSPVSGVRAPISERVASWNTVADYLVRDPAPVSEGPQIALIMPFTNGGIAPIGETGIVTA